VLILPKLFRRATDYLTARRNGFTGSFVEWLRTAMSGGVGEDDLVEIGGRRVPFPELIHEHGPRISVDADLLDLVFVEK
jgi:hypothetical protein